MNLTEKGDETDAPLKTHPLGTTRVNPPWQTMPLRDCRWPLAVLGQEAWQHGHRSLGSSHGQ